LKAELYAAENPGGKTRISLELRGDGSVQLFYHDIGRTALEMFGNSDYEAWLSVPADAVPALCFAMLREVLSGECDALTRVRDLCNRNEVKHDAGVWT
jgi:hypothetical protein